ncbi:MAG: hypothetical protein IJ679_03225, partial [Lachnospiraceae bacterium]|nr:hypothetical protein [Lachnospiraceae bacterium]
MKEKKNLVGKKEWRDLFEQKQLDTAQNYIVRGNYRDFECSDAKASVSVGASTRNQFHPYITFAPTCFTENWEEKQFFCNCSRANPSHYSSAQKKPCSHEAVLLFLWERVHGPWEFEETDEEYETRIREERIGRIEAKRAKQQATEEKVKRKAAEWSFAKYEGKEALYFDIPSAIRNEKTNLWALHRGEEILKE